MAKYAFFGITCLALGTAQVWGCSSKAATEDGAGGAGAGPQLDMSKGQGANAGDAKGGTVVLTAEEVAQKESSACVGWKAEAESGPSTLMLVVDTSQSMLSAAPNSTQTKWALTRDALTQAVKNLSAPTFAGLLFYPNRATTASGGTVAQDASACIDVNGVIPVAQLGNTDSAVRRTLLNALTTARPQGCTPTHNAFLHALNQGLLPSKGGGRRYMLLITDGQPTLGLGCLGSCNPAQPNDTQPIVDEIARAYRDDGVGTFVIGAPGSEKNETTGQDVRAWLSQAARAGGTALAGCSDRGPNFCHFDMSQVKDFGAGLQEALATISGQIAACSYSLPAPPPGENINKSQINLIVKNTDGTTQAKSVLFSANADCSVGWYFDPDGKVSLCRDSCSEVQKDPKAKLQLLFGCATDVIPQ